MKIRVEQSENPSEEIIIRCGSNADAELIRRAVADSLQKKEVLPLRLGRAECFVPVSDILFFETQGDRVAAHTADSMYGAAFTLRELETVLPACFVKAGKSCIVNTAAVTSVERNLTGPSEISFEYTYKKAYVSRKYYKEFVQKSRETRLKK